MKTLIDLLQKRALEHADRLAFTFLTDGENEKKFLTFGELDRQAKAIGAMLQKNIKPQDRVLLLYPPGLDFITALFGCLYAGAIAVPVYPPEPARLFETLPRLLGPAKDAQPKIALTTQKILSIAFLLFKFAPHLRNIHWLATHALKEIENAWQEPLLTHDSLACLMYTSGSTGNPKGVMLSHGNFLHQMKLLSLQEDIKPSERGVSWVPPYHISGLFIGIFMPVYSGIQNVLMSPLHFLQKPYRWLKAVSQYRAFTSGAPNFAYELCVRQITHQEKETLDLSCWRHAITGSERIHPETLDNFAETFQSCGFKKTSFIAVYGLTESTMIGSLGQTKTPPLHDTIKMTSLEENRIVRVNPDDKDVRTVVGCGKAIGDTRIIAVQPDSLTQCKPDQVGEIWISGPIVAHGYWNQPEETQKTFEGYLADTKEGPFLRTGDLGYIDKEEVFITGRLKEMIIIRGTNHYPEDIEQTVEKSHPLLRSSSGAAFSIEADGEERLVIVQEVEDLKKSRINEVMENIREVVSKHYNIQVYAIALIEPESIPRTVTKKIQRYVSRAAFLDGSLKIIASWQKEKITKIKSLPKRRTFLPLKSKKLESWLISKISEKLGMDSSEINIEKPLVSYGLDSLSAVRLTAEIEEELGATLLIATLFESPSIKHIAQELKTQLSSKKRTSQSKKMHLDLNAEVHLDSTLVFETFKNGSFVNPTSIFLTGATGFLGAFLLYEILKNTSAKVYCLARAFDQQGAKQRIQKNLEFFSLWKDHFNERITPVNGDLSKPLFGLPFQEFESLTQKIDIIYHIGAIVNFIYSYRDLKASNVEGTHEIIHLAVKNKLKPVHHISTISVFPLEGHPEGKNFFEQDTPFYAQGLLNGYAQSKWVAEKTMIVAREKGLPVTIYRVGEVIGHSKSGICRAAHDAYSNMIKGAILLGSAPEMNINLYLVPVDYVSRSIFHLSKETGSLGKNFHIVSEPMEGTKTLDVMASLGYPLRRLQYHEWLNEVDRLNKGFPQNPLAALMPLFTSPTVIRLSQATTRLKLDRQNLAKELEKTSIACSPAEELLMTYLNYLKRSGFLNGTLESLSQ